MMKALIRQGRHLWLPASLIALATGALLWQPPATTLERIQRDGELVVVSFVSPSLWYQDQHGATGFEYQLSQAFAQELGVSLRMEQASSLTDLQERLNNGSAHMAAAHLGLSPELQHQFPVTGEILPQKSLVLYRTGQQRPRSLEEISGMSLALLENSVQDFTFTRGQLAAELQVSLERIASGKDEDLMGLLSEGIVDLAVVGEHAWQLHRSLYPDLSRAFELSEHSLVWALTRHADSSLINATQRFLTQRKADGTVTRLASRFYGQQRQLDIFSARSFLRHLEVRLPQYARYFKEAAEEQGFDWRLLAAVGYQESLWDSGAVSPTGVRGLMMLTHRTAREMGVQDRTNPEQSIRAGAAYLRKLHDRIPARIQEPDRTWLALAAYNVGSGHLEDARILTQRQGGNPDSWQDVRTRLPLLRDPKFYQNTRYGFARGTEPVIYVSQIRHYYDLMVWANESSRFNQMLFASLGNAASAHAN